MQELVLIVEGKTQEPKKFTELYLSGTDLVAPGAPFEAKAIVGLENNQVRIALPSPIDRKCWSINNAPVAQFLDRITLNVGDRLTFVGAIGGQEWRVESTTIKGATPALMLVRERVSVAQAA
jgi:hypothetical protein